MAVCGTTRPLVDHLVTTWWPLVDHYYSHWKYPRCYMHLWCQLLLWHQHRSLMRFLCPGLRIVTLLRYTQHQRGKKWWIYCILYIVLYIVREVYFQFQGPLYFCFWPPASNPFHSDLFFTIVKIGDKGGWKQRPRDIQSIFIQLTAQEIRITFWYPTRNAQTIKLVLSSWYKK